MREKELETGGRERCERKVRKEKTKKEMMVTIANHKREGVGDALIMAA